MDLVEEASFSGQNFRRAGGCSMEELRKIRIFGFSL
jgi:hypothetical protein